MSCRRGSSNSWAGSSGPWFCLLGQLGIRRGPGVVRAAPRSGTESVDARAGGDLFGIDTALRGARERINDHRPVAECDRSAIDPGERMNTPVLVVAVSEIL